ncbi:MAG: arylsulfatase [Planctomycetes bacterium]|nr:arylsulfatase [Planctomycetota bacterium]
MKNLLTIIILGLSSLAAADKPNIIFILVDDMGYSDIGCYGGEVKTPNLDRLAQNGLRFTQMHNTAKCFPSRATLLTGLYAQDCGMSHSFQKFSNAVTIAEVLKKTGYRTLASGKHHSKESLFDRGFDRYFGLLDGATNHFNPGLQRDGEVKPAQKKYGKRSWAIDDKVMTPYTPPQKDFYSTDIYTKYAVDYLEEYKSEDKPFFLYLAYTAPHDPLQAWWEDVAKYKDTYKVGYEAIRKARIAKLKQLGLVDAQTKVSDAVHKPWASLDNKTKEIEARKMAIYAAMIDRVDQKVGELIAKLEQLGELENTLIMFAADNGSSGENAEKGVQKKNMAGHGFPLEKIHTSEYWASLGKNWANVSNTPFRENKTSSYEGGICTPFIVHWPKGIAKPGTINKKHVGHFVDVMATIVDITGAEYPAEFKGEKVNPMAGVSFLPELKGNQESKNERDLFWQWSKGKAMRQGKWKVVAKGKKWELFDMEVDVNETTDLSKKYPELFDSMKKQWGQWYESTSAP